jgi:hypothetical protein
MKHFPGVIPADPHSTGKESVIQRKEEEREEQRRHGRGGKVLPYSNSDPGTRNFTN